MPVAPTLGSTSPEVSPTWANRQAKTVITKLKGNVAAIATSVLALSGAAQAGPLTRDNMPDAPVVFSSNWYLSNVPGVFTLTDIVLRLTNDFNAEGFTTDWSVRFLDDGSIEMILNVLEDGQSAPAFSTRYDRYETPVPWIWIFYNGSTAVWNFDGGPGYSTINFGNTEEYGTRFTAITPASSVPEPSALVLGATALAGLALNRRKKKPGSEDQIEKENASSEQETV
jgi:PEP-CTERM motif